MFGKIAKQAKTDFTKKSTGVPGAERWDRYQHVLPLKCQEPGGGKLVWFFRYPC